MSIDATVPANLQAPPELGSAELDRLLEQIGADVFERERDGIPPFDAIDLVRRSRLGALRLPREEGGADATLRDHFAMLIRLAEVDPNLAHILRVHFFTVENLIHSPFPERDRRRREEVAKGTIFGGSLTELGTGNTGQYDPAAFKTVIAPHGDGFVLDGTKYYSTGSMYSDILSVTGRTPDDRIVTAVFPADREGVTLEDDWDGMGQALTGTGTSRFEHVHIAADEIQDDGERGDRPRYTGAFMQLHLTALIAGILAAASRDAVALVRSRDRTFTHAPSETAPTDPILQEGVGQMVAAAYAAESAVLIAAEAIDDAADSVVDGAPDPALAERASLQAAKAKVVVDGLAGGVGWTLFDVGGASATKRSKNLDRHWRNARTVASHNPTSYKAMVIGDVAINGSPLPPSWFF
ncbi:MAG TPA: acyl-CoA dehydrogenase family protein [Solirubrobacterales bacterium]|nr:acyl-CoA dehydrogenase family protein [Solirubrobacterales bacterium]